MYNLHVKHILVILGIIFIIFTLIYFFAQSQKPIEQLEKVTDTSNTTVTDNTEDITTLPAANEQNGGAQTGIANPASQYCEESGGELEIITESDGSQLGLCKFSDYACEEWAYYNGDCDIEKDAEAIKQVLIAKGLDLSQMKIVIYTHLGRDISGSVTPVNGLGGGGYVYAVKTDEGITIIADGNGIISCAQFEEYPDFSTYLIPECIDEAGSPMVR